jgi:cytochrome c oxidase subunit 3
MNMSMTNKTEQKRMHPHKFTLWVAIGSLLMMFAGLTSAFIVKSNQVNWKPVTMPVWFTASTILMLISSGTMQLALKSFRERVMRNYRLWMLVTLLLGVAFVASQWIGFQELWSKQVTFQGAGAGQFLYVIFGLHALHVLAGVIVLIIMAIRSFSGAVKNYSPVPVEIAATYWHFVDLLWIYLFVFFLVVGSGQ